MTSTTKILSYAAIIQYLEVHKTATAHQLKERLAEHELPSSDATFERLKQDLITFGVELVYHDRAYVLRLHDNPHRSVFFHIVHLIQEVQVFQKLIVEGDARERVILESKDPPNFYSLISPLFSAITENKKINFTYNHFIKGKLADLQLHPYLLREHNRRWYVIGYSDFNKGNRTFAVDRIENLYVLDEKFAQPKITELVKEVRESYGVNFSQNKIRLVLKAMKPQNAYLANLPIHDSQKEIESADEYSIFEYQLRPNYELEQELMRLSDQIRILEPDWLREKVRERLLVGTKLNG